jgi:hypothetical protein
MRAEKQEEFTAPVSGILERSVIRTPSGEGDALLFVLLPTRASELLHSDRKTI